MNLSRRPWTSPLLASLALALGVVNVAHAQQPVPSLESPIIRWTNYYRQQNGRAPLQPNERLSQAARRHAYNMAQKEQMAHVLDDGSTPAERAKQSGYAFALVGENVAWNEGYDNPAWKFFEGWMDSPGHWQNIIHPQFSEIGVGVFRSSSGKYYACQVFGSPASGWQAPTNPSGPVYPGAVYGGPASIPQPPAFEITPPRANTSPAPVYGSAPAYPGTMYGGPTSFPRPPAVDIAAPRANAGAGPFPRPPAIDVSPPPPGQGNVRQFEVTSSWTMPPIDFYSPQEDFGVPKDFGAPNWR